MYKTAPELAFPVSFFAKSHVETDQMILDDAQTSAHDTTRSIIRGRQKLAVESLELAITYALTV